MTPPPASTPDAVSQEGLETTEKFLLDMSFIDLVAVKDENIIELQKGLENCN